MDTNMNMGTPTPEEKTPVGAIVGIVVIVLVLAVGAFYFFQQVPLPADDEILTPAETQADSSISNLSTQGTSTNIEDIKKDLDKTDLTGIDAGLNDIAI